MKILVLGVDNITTWLLINYLKKNYEIEFVIFKKHSKFKILKNKLHKQSLYKIIGQLLFFIYSKVFIPKQKDYISKVLSKNNLEYSKILANDNFNAVNDSDSMFISKISQISHDIIIINGTRILSKSILNSSKAPFLNIHCGITPAYRGVHGAYWSLYNSDIANCGVTLHIVDQTIDGGDIIDQSQIKITPKDNYNTYPILQYVQGIKMLEKALKYYLIHKKFTSNIVKKKYLNSKIYGHPTILQYLSGLRRGVK